MGNNYEIDRGEVKCPGEFHVKVEGIDVLYAALKGNASPEAEQPFNIFPDFGEIKRRDIQGEMYMCGLTIAEENFEQGCFSKIKITAEQPTIFEGYLENYFGGGEPMTTAPSRARFKLHALMNFREITMMDDKSSKKIMESLGSEGQPDVFEFMMRRKFDVIDQESGLHYSIYIPLSSPEEVVEAYKHSTNRLRDFLRDWLPVSEDEMDAIDQDKLVDPIELIEGKVNIEEEEELVDSDELIKETNYLLVQCTNVYEPIGVGDRWIRDRYIPLGTKDEFEAKIRVFAGFLERVANAVSDTMNLPQEGNLIIHVPLKDGGK